MTDLVKVGPPDYHRLPNKSLGIIFFNEMKKWDPSRLAMIDWTGEEVNYGRILELSVKLALQLKEAGIKKGDVISILSQNNWKYQLTVISGFYIGAKINLLNPDFTPGELKHFLSICRPVVVFCTAKVLENLLKLKDEDYFPARIILYDSEASADLEHFDEFVEAGSFDQRFSPVEVDPQEDVAFLLTSSGTTGLPKVIQLTHTNFRITLIHVGEPNWVDITEKKTSLVYMPFFHIVGIGLCLGTILYGGKLVILEKFLPDRFLNLIQEHKIAKLLAVPATLLFLAKSPLVQKYDLSSVTDVLCGSSPLVKELEEEVTTLLKIKSVRHIYGLTEISGLVTATPKNVTKIRSTGQVVTGQQIKVCDPESGKVLGVNEVGELRIKGAGLMKGYLGNEGLTVLDEEGYFKSGDLGYFDEEGFFYIMDRLKEMIKYKGFQVAPAELEALLFQHPAVKDVGVVGIPDEKAGEVPLAFVVKQPNQNVSEEELVRYVAENISIQKHLHGGVRFIEQLPKNSTGKTLRIKLKKLL